MGILKEQLLIVLDDVPNHRWRARTLAGLTAAAILLLAACSGAVEDSEADSGGGNALPADFQITAYQGSDVLGGQQLNLSDVLAGGRPVVLNFWAGLCPPCRLEIPDLQAVSEHFGDHVVVLGLDVGPFTALGSREDGQALLKELNVTFPAGTTFDAKAMRDYKITGMPSTLFINPDGQVVRKWTGVLNESKLTELVKELLDASGAS